MLKDVYDYIVVGAGSAGCALATSLSENGRHSVLLLEAGTDDRWIWTRIPAGVYYLLRSERGLWRFFTEPEPEMKGRRIFWPRGKILGGSSTVNGMIWVHGDPAEYDMWAGELGLAGWGASELKPLFRSLETYQKGEPAHRGRSGPVHVSEFTPHRPLMDAFLEACSSAGIPRNADYNGARYEGAGYLQFNTRRGWRQGGREAFLRGASGRANLTVAQGALVRRVTFEGRRASGVEVEIGGERKLVRCGREIVLSAGAIQSPQLLELSGVGRADHLRGLGIGVVHDLPGVGENLHDHLHTRLSYRCRNVVTLNQIMPNAMRKGLMGLRWLTMGDGLMSCSGQIIHALARSAPGVLQPDVKIQLHYLSSPDARDPNKLVLDEFPGISVGTFPLRPESRGSVHIQSADPTQAPAMRANYLATEGDRAVTVAAIRMARKVMAQPAMAPYFVEEIRPGPQAEDDEALLDFVRSSAQTSYHPVGSCRMGVDGAAVVDGELRVRGLEGLRVADASIIPTMCSANTNAPAMVIGLKAAQMMLAAAR